MSTSTSNPPADLPSFNKSKHITYWLRCLKTYLPWQYTANDSNRMMLAFFTISALDLLSSLESSTTAQERAGYIDWIYGCQHPDGGFRGFPGTDFGGRANAANALWDPANVPATYFALCMLLILRDDLARVKRDECLAWLTRMQRPDGSFGQTLGEEGKIEGGTDTRFAFTAIGIRWVLGGGVDGGIGDVDVEKLVQCIKELQTYDGGIADKPFHEAHGGFTCCAVSALSLLDRISDGIQNPDTLLRWVVSRQTTVLDEDDQYPDKVQAIPIQHDKTGDQEDSDHNYIGFNGRCNKMADTCYSWWIGVILKIMGRLDLIDTTPTRRYLLGKTQHFIGGFGKMPGDPPDLYHSYLGLAALSVFGQPELKPVHPAACLSMDACEYLKTLSWKQKARE